MNNLMNTENNRWPTTYSGSVGNIASEVLSAIPLSLAAPILSYQRTKAQKELIALLIEAKRIERSEILKTMQVLAIHGQLTPELSQQLMVAYYQQPY